MSYTQASAELVIILAIQPYRRRKTTTHRLYPVRSSRWSPARPGPAVPARCSILARGWLATAAAAAGRIVEQSGVVPADEWLSLSLAVVVVVSPTCLQTTIRKHDADRPSVQSARPA